MKEMTPEELDAYWESIPEWKRGALVVQDAEGEVVEEAEGVFKRLRSKVSNRVKETSLVKDLMEKEGENIDWARKEYNQFKSDAKEQIETSHNPVIRGTAMAVDKVKSETQWTKAVRVMKAYDAEFDLEELPFEAEEIFKEFYCNYLSGNKEYLKLCSTGSAAVLQTMIDLRAKEGWRYKYEELLDCNHPSFNGAKMNDGQPCFTFTVDVQEFDQRVMVSDGSPYVWTPPPPEAAEEGQEGEKAEGSKQEEQQQEIPKKSMKEKIMGKRQPKAETGNSITRCTYQFTLQRHQDPDMEVTGHYWEFTEFQKLAEQKQIA